MARAARTENMARSAYPHIILPNQVHRPPNSHPILRDQNRGEIAQNRAEPRSFSGHATEAQAGCPPKIFKSTTRAARTKWNSKTAPKSSNPFQLRLKPFERPAAFSSSDAELGENRQPMQNITSTPPPVRRVPWSLVD